MSPAAVEEIPQTGESPEAYTRRVAHHKAAQVAGSAGAEALVLAADTEVVIDGSILGKPADGGDARRMLRLLAGRAHEVLTTVVLLGRGRAADEVSISKVWFAPMTEREIEWYVASGEPMGKAGGYAIQGLGARFVERIEGSWSNVVGLPLATVHRLLRAVE